MLERRMPARLIKSWLHTLKTRFVNFSLPIAQITRRTCMELVHLHIQVSFDYRGIDIGDYGADPEKDRYRRPLSKDVKRVIVALAGLHMSCKLRAQ